MDALLGTHHLVHFGGSELVMYDLAKHFRSTDHNVTVVTFLYDYPVRKLFEEAQIRVINILQDKLTQTDFDLMWTQHWPVLYDLFYRWNVNVRHAVHSCLSPYEPLERPPLFANHLSLCLANSNETRDRLIAGKVKPDQIYVFGNCVPDDYFEYYKENLTDLKRIAVVSNHVPEEVRSAANLLNGRGLKVDIYGIGHLFQHVTKDVLLDYDAVITIGRTVQQAMALGIPVYCYDRFGGPGWLTHENFKKAEHFNFSGRCTRRKLNEHQLVSEVINRYPAALQSRKQLYHHAVDNYRLSKNVNHVLKLVDQKPPVDKKNIMALYPSVRERNENYLRTLVERKREG